MTWVEAARGAFERLLEAEADAGREGVRGRLEGLRLAYLDQRADGTDRPLAEGTAAARTRGVWVLWMLRQALSPPLFETIRRVWRQGGALETEDLRDLAERQGRLDLGNFFDYWVFATHLPEFRLRQAEASCVKPSSGRAQEGGFALTIRVENLGSGVWPAPIVVQTEEGARHEFAAPVGPGAAAGLQVGLLTRPVCAAVDPEGDVLMATGERIWLPVRFRRFWLF